MRSVSMFAVLLTLGCGGDWVAGPTGAPPYQATPVACAPASSSADQSAAGHAGTSPELVCGPEFASGVNVAWLSYANDIPAPQLCRFRPLFDNVQAAGGRVVRWWLHTDGSKTPDYDADGKVLPIDADRVAEVRMLLDLAAEAGVMLAISLWSFNMLEAGPIDDNVLLLTQDDHRQAYIDNVLVPLVRAMKGHPALYAWEAFNEPEGMSDEHGWLSRTVPMAAIQRTINWFGDTVHTEDPRARFTNGCVSFWTCSSIEGAQNYYSDAELISAGGRPQGTLDFYEVHYYAHNTRAASPFLLPASHWGLDKPIVIGEFWAKDTDGVARDDLFSQLSASGYAGAWAWQYANGDPGNDGETNTVHMWPAMQPGLEALRDTAGQSLEIVCR